jgi:hypothetical protein
MCREFGPFGQESVSDDAIGPTIRENEDKGALTALVDGTGHRSVLGCIGVVAQHGSQECLTSLTSSISSLAKVQAPSTLKFCAVAERH